MEKEFTQEREIDHVDCPRILCRKAAGALKPKIDELKGVVNELAEISTSELQKYINQANPEYMDAQNKRWHKTDEAFLAAIFALSHIKDMQFYLINPIYDICPICPLHQKTESQNISRESSKKLSADQLLQMLLLRVNSVLKSERQTIFGKI